MIYIIITSSRCPVIAIADKADADEGKNDVHWIIAAMALKALCMTCKHELYYMFFHKAPYQPNICQYEAR